MVLLLFRSLFIFGTDSYREKKKKRRKEITHHFDHRILVIDLQKRICFFRFCIETLTKIKHCSLFHFVREKYAQTLWIITKRILHYVIFSPKKKLFIQCLKVWIGREREWKKENKHILNEMTSISRLRLEIWFCWCYSWCIWVAYTSHYLQQTYLHQIEHLREWKRRKAATIV